MAAPHVAGVAALLKSANPGWTAVQLRTAILGSVDQIAAFNGVVATGGRLNAYRAIIPSGITLTSPNGGGTYQRGRNLYINWTSKGLPGQNVSLELLKGGALNTTIAASTYNSGYHTWSIPSGQTVGTDYRVRVNLLSSGASDQSDSDFAITTNSPTPTVIQIGTLERLRQMSDNWGDSQNPRNGHYVLTANIDARATRDWNGGLGWKPIGNNQNDFFGGTFDGQGFNITEIYCTRPNEAYAALFSVTWSGSVIRNLNIEVKNWRAGGYRDWGGLGYGGVGALVGENSGLIQNCHVSVNSANTMYVTNGSHCGGIVGENYRGTILNCSVTGTTDIEARGASSGDGLGGIAGVNSGLIRWCWVGPDVSIDGDVSGANSDEIGGIVGSNEGGQVVECESRARFIDGAYYVGGVVGANSSGGLISDCYFRGANVTSDGIRGGIVGRNYSGTISNIYVSGIVATSGSSRGALAGENNSILAEGYWNTAVTSLPATGSNSGTVTNCFGRTATEMMQQTSFTNWNFESVWAISEGLDLPVLRGVGLSLAVPTGVSASTGLWDGVHISWNTVPEASYYLVFRADSLNGPKEALSGKWLAGVGFVDTTAAPLTTFYYWVKAGTTRDGGRGSEFSASTTGSRALPRPLLAASRQGGNIVLTWPANAAGFNLVSVTNVASTNWILVSPSPVIVNGLYTVTNTATGPAKFYRLRNP